MKEEPSSCRFNSF